MTTDNFCFYLWNRLMQTSQTGGQWYSDTSPFSIPWWICDTLHNKDLPLWWVSWLIYLCNKDLRLIIDIHFDGTFSTFLKVASLKSTCTSLNFNQTTWPQYLSHLASCFNYFCIYFPFIISFVNSCDVCVFYFCIFSNLTYFNSFYYILLSWMSLLVPNKRI
jgi:hypothetical protein